MNRIRLTINLKGNSYKEGKKHIRLLCFHYAGGSSSIFFEWSKLMPDFIEMCPVELPGRGALLKEKPFTHIRPLVEEVVGSIFANNIGKFALFGHSMGALIAFEVARFLHKRHLSAPLHLFVSGCNAPQIPVKEPPRYCLPKDRLIEYLREFEGTPDAILENTELMSIMIPIIRADFSICDTYQYSKFSPLKCPITAFGGKNDRRIKQHEISAWREQTQGKYRMQMFEGNHFFIRDKAMLLIRAISHDLSAYITKTYPKTYC